MQLAQAKLLNGLAMCQSAVAFVPLETVAGKESCASYHQSIAPYLGGYRGE